MEKRYYWFKMEDDFFQKKEIKKLRSIAGGDTFVLIYLKLILKSLKNGGKLYFEGIEDNFYEEMALEIDEKPDNVNITINYLLQKKLIFEESETEYKLNDIGIESKTSTALRVSRFREKQKETEPLHLKQEPLHLNKSVTGMKQNDNGETETEIEIETEIETEINYFDEKIRKNWLRWIDFKKQQFNNRYKTKDSEQMGINKLIELCRGNYDNAEKIVNQSIANLWKGLFELKIDQKKRVGQMSANDMLKEFDRQREERGYD